MPSHTKPADLARKIAAAKRRPADIERDLDLRKKPPAPSIRKRARKIEKRA